MAGMTANRAPIREIAQMVGRSPAFTKKYGITDWTEADYKANQLGYGVYAFAFALPDGAKVLKVTDDPDDAKAAALIRDKGRGVVGLPLVHEVLELRGKSRMQDPQRLRDRDTPLYAVVVEKVRKLSSEQDFDERVPEIAKGVMWLKQRGFDVRDLHNDNIGVTMDNRGVLIDFGHGSSTGEEDEVAIPVAENTRRRSHRAASLMSHNRSVSSEDARHLLRDLGNPRVSLDEFRMGLEAEQEHTDDLHEAGRIALDHLREFPDYYTRLTKMEERAKAGLAPNPSGPVIDNKDGIGSTPNNDNVDYMGMRMLMRPSTFLNLARHLPSTQVRKRSVDYIREAMEQGRGVGPPTLYVHIPDGWEEGDLSEPAKVSGHEGRHRAKTAMDLFGDKPFEMHLFPVYFRNRDLTPEWIERLRSGLISEDGDPVRGPLFEPMTMAKNGGSPELRRTSRIFDECFDVVEERFPDFGECELHHDERAAADNGTGSERQFGYCMDGDPLVIAFASKIEDMPDEYIRGLMRHEFGHAIDFRYGKDLGKMLGRRLPDGIERRADVIAECVFGDPIEYGHLDIQCIGCGGKTPRPGRLQK
jgi:hypothetical protein